MASLIWGYISDLDGAVWSGAPFVIAERAVASASSLPGIHERESNLGVLKFLGFWLRLIEPEYDLFYRVLYEIFLVGGIVRS